MARILATLIPVVAGSDASWQWVGLKGTKCLSGEETGVWVRKSATSQKLGVHLNGGGACFNGFTCAAASTAAKPASPAEEGIFDSRSDNPLKDYNWIDVPYCTGDVHSGEGEATIEQKSYTFHGAANLKLVMQFAAQTFDDVDTLFVTGESAGGVGAAASYVTIRDAFPQARGVLVDDSGPVLDDSAIAPCLQEEWRRVWSLNKNLPSDCPCNNDKGNLVSAWPYLKQRYPKDSLGLISSQSDSTISLFFAFGLNNCEQILPFGYSGLQGGLERLSKSVPVYQIPGSSHEHTHTGEFYNRTVNNVPMFKWVDQLVDDSRPDPSSIEPSAEDLYDEMRSNSYTATVV